MAEQENRIVDEICLYFCHFLPFLVLALPCCDIPNISTLFIWIPFAYENQNLVQFCHFSKMTSMIYDRPHHKSNLHINCHQTDDFQMSLNIRQNIRGLLGLCYTLKIAPWLTCVCVLSVNSTKHWQQCAKEKNICLWKSEFRVLGSWYRFEQNRCGHMFDKEGGDNLRKNNTISTSQYHVHITNVLIWYYLTH